MTTNIDRAADIVRENSFSRRSEDVAQALADATPPLLMPDLPEPEIENYSNQPTWFDSEVEVRNGAVEFYHGGYANEENDYICSPAVARDLAYALLAAANYAEKNKE